jgi:serine protease Do
MKPGESRMYDPLRAKGKVVVYSTVAFVFGVALASGMGWTESSHAMPVIDEAPQVREAAVKPAMDLSDAFVNLADAVTPAVVRIESVRRGQPVDSEEIPDQFRRFFNLPEGDEAAPRVAGGSGFIISEDGYILTNNHVVEGADQLTVFLSDRRYYQAEIIGNDPFTDVAVIKIDAGEPVPAMSFGDSDDVRVGEWVLAIGNPGFANSTQLDFTVTAGIVSARGRGLQLLQRDAIQRFGNDLAGYTIEDFIQTDAVINPGNSGGPMINLQGQVVGINSAIATNTGVYAGYGFAIPVNLARRVMEDLIEYGTVKRPRLGVQIEDVDPEDAEIYRLPSVSGILVDRVPDDGPAADILEAEDVIVALNGDPVGYVAELQAKIAGYRPGDRVTVTIYRDGSPMDVTIRLAEAPINDIPTRTATQTEFAVERLGINVEAMDAQTAELFGVAGGEGVILSNVARASPASRRGVAQYIGWRLLRINDSDVRTTEDVRTVLSGVEPGQIVQLYFEHPDGQNAFENVRMPS